MITDTDEGVTRETAKCVGCGATFSALVYRMDPEDAPMFRQRACEECVRARGRASAEEQALRDRERESECERRWEAVCPFEFRTIEEGGRTDEVRFMEQHKDAPTILAHPFGPVGLLLRGNTDAGKTRIMWRLLRRYFEQREVLGQRLTIAAFSHGEFQRECQDAAGNHRSAQWFRTITTADVFLLDDMGKGPWTENTVSAFFDLVKCRTEAGLPLFITTNLNGATLVAQLKLSKDMAEPLIRRLREFTVQIVMG